MSYLSLSIALKSLRYFPVRFVFCRQNSVRSVILPASPRRRFCRSAPPHKQRTSGKQGKNNSPGPRFPPSSPGDILPGRSDKTGRKHTPWASGSFASGMPAFFHRSSAFSDYPLPYPASIRPAHRNRRDTGYRLLRPQDTRRIARSRRRFPAASPRRCAPSRQTAGR